MKLIFNNNLYVNFLFPCMFEGSIFTLNPYCFEKYLHGLGSPCHFQLSLIFVSLLTEVYIYVEWHLEY